MQNNFSYTLKLEDMSSATKRYDFTATPLELKTIADILKLPKVESFVVSIDVTLNKGAHLVKLNGKLNSVVEQISVISLEKFTQQYVVDFERNFDTRMNAKQQRELEDFEDINADIPDVMENGAIDLKAIALEALALELDDFPRKKGETFKFAAEFDQQEKANNPFDVLKKLKK